MKFNTLHIALLVSILLAACQQSTPKTAQPTTANQETLPWATDIDLVCEMKVDKTTEDTVHYNGKIYGFCNPGCKETFQENPAKYGAK
ncbi:MAG: YHS domain-containing protein [Saprospiraceae bacterium]|nr:YHS domain-containing protein [Saprospiraceae bacterium]